MTETELLLVGCEAKFIEKMLANNVEVKLNLIQFKKNNPNFNSLNKITENQPPFDYSLESQLAIQLTPQRATLKLKKSNYFLYRKQI